MALLAISQRRTHGLLLFNKLLNLRDGASPFTLLLDTLEQSAQSVVKEFMSRAKVSKTRIIFISFQTMLRPKDIDVFIKAYKISLATLQQEITAYVSPSAAATASMNVPTTRNLIVFDSLNQLATTSAPHLSPFLGSLLGPTVSVLATYHTDIPLHSSSSEDPSSNMYASHNPYAADPLTTLMYLATAILRISSLSHAVEKRRARDRSLAEPDFGLEERRDGVLIGLKGVQTGVGEVVVNMEVRRKSGRGVRDVFVLDTSSSTSSATAASTQSPAAAERVAAVSAARAAGLGVGWKMCLLDDHPLYAPLSMTDTEDAAAIGGDKFGQASETTFSLGLTEKQRRDRERVVLPYFDAQRGEGSGEGGRILYEMDRVDDFDEEEDEI